MEVTSDKRWLDVWFVQYLSDNPPTLILNFLIYEKQ
jgi:hypothetical protein